MLFRRGQHLANGIGQQHDWDGGGTLRNSQMSDAEATAQLIRPIGLLKFDLDIAFKANERRRTAVEGIPLFQEDRQDGPGFGEFVTALVGRRGSKALLSCSTLRPVSFKVGLISTMRTSRVFLSGSFAKPAKSLTL
jgi:hypothetical protein